MICAELHTHIYIYCIYSCLPWWSGCFSLAFSLAERERERFKDAKVKASSQDEPHAFLFGHVFAETDPIDMHSAV